MLNYAECIIEAGFTEKISNRAYGYLFQLKLHWLIPAPLFKLF